MERSLDSSLAIIKKKNKTRVFTLLINFSKNKLLRGRLFRDCKLVSTVLENLHSTREVSTVLSTY